VPYTTVAPTIDGTISGDTGWGAATPQTVSFLTYTGVEHNETIYAEHDNSYLYLGIQSGLSNGWDAYSSVFIDGNNDGIADGSLTSPHIDIRVGQPSPGGWWGYGGYTVFGEFPNVYPAGGNVTPPAGTQTASAGSSDVSYEYRISLADLGLQTGDTAGIAFENGTNGTTDGTYWYTSNAANSQSWGGLDPIDEWQDHQYDDAFIQLQLDSETGTSTTSGTTPELPPVALLGALPLGLAWLRRRRAA
jgi:MYXO-CTERM domain-containing protein